MLKHLGRRTKWKRKEQYSYDSFESGEYGSEGVKLDYELTTYEY